MGYILRELNQTEISNLIEQTFNIDYSGKLGDGDLIKHGVSETLDEYLYSLKNSKQTLKQYLPQIL